MIDGRCVAVLAGVALLWALATGGMPDAMMLILLAFLALLFLVILPALLQESAWQLFASPPTRPIVNLRWHLRRRPGAAQPARAAGFARKLAAEAGLTFDPDDPAEGDRLKALALRVARVNLDAPSMFAQGLGPRDLAAALALAAPAGRRPPDPGRHWPGAEIRPGPLRRVPRLLKAPFFRQDLAQIEQLRLRGGLSAGGITFRPGPGPTTNRALADTFARYADAVLMDTGLPRNAAS